MVRARRFSEDSKRKHKHKQSRPKNIYQIVFEKNEKPRTLKLKNPATLYVPDTRVEQFVVRIYRALVDVVRSPRHIDREKLLNGGASRHRHDVG